MVLTFKCEVNKQNTYIIYFDFHQSLHCNISKIKLIALFDNPDQFIVHLIKTASSASN